MCPKTFCEQNDLTVCEQVCLIEGNVKISCSMSMLALFSASVAILNDESALTGAERFRVNEIEIFEIADSTALPADVKKCANGRLFQKRTRDADAGAAGRLQETQADDNLSRRLFVADEFARPTGQLCVSGSEEEEEERRDICAGRSQSG
jgi:hypothetical protein